MLLVLTTAAGLNFAIDPAGIYREGRVNPQAYADALVQSKHGLMIPENAFDDRLVSKALAKYSQRVECVVIGSSHVRQVSSDRPQKSLEKECGSILNLSVSGAGIEDHLALTYLALQSGRPKKIILGVDPWTLTFGKGQSWTAYRNDYIQARTEILGKRSDAEGRTHDKAAFAKLLNLINLEYTLRSAGTAIHDFRNGAPTITAAPELNPVVGWDYSVQLKDGSHVYSAKYIVEASQNIIPLGGSTYLTDGELNQKVAIDTYRALLQWVRSQNVEPILLLTPYHENVWKSPDSPNTVALRGAEPVVINLAHELDVKLIGSYDPRITGCQSNEFYDFMHPTAACLSRLAAR